MRTINSLQKNLRECRACPNVCGTPVHGEANGEARILLVGQAPGPHEAGKGKPFAYTSGKTLFKWLGEISEYDEDTLRQMIYFTAVARCFPGKNPGGSGDREPDESEIANCRKFLEGEVRIVKPKIILAVGKLAIREVIGLKKSISLNDVVGNKFIVDFHGQTVTVIPLPHPSGISTWFKREPGRKLLKKALSIVKSEAFS